MNRGRYVTFQGKGAVGIPQCGGRQATDCPGRVGKQTAQGNLWTGKGVYNDMRRQWTLRQLLATVRGIGLMLALFWVFIGAQFLPPFLRGGFAGMREHLNRVATAGVPEENWPAAIAHMREALVVLAVFLVALVLLQRYLGRKLVRESDHLLSHQSR